MPDRVAEDSPLQVSPISGTVIGEGGWRGRIEPAPAVDPPQPPHVTIRPEDGGPSLTIPADLLIPQTDGTYRLPFVRSAVAAHATEVGTIPDASALASGDRLVIPIVEEAVDIRKRWVDQGGGVRITKTVTEHTASVDEPLHREVVSVDRVPINRIVEAATAPYEDGDTFVVPVYEETLVVEKRLVLREELRITRQRVVDRHEQQTVSLRREEAVVEQRPRVSDTPS